MYKSIPEVNRLCAISDRARQYRLHKEALKRIEAGQYQNSNRKTRSNLAAHPLKRTLHGKAQKMEQERISYENKKILDAMEKREPTINLADFQELQMEHERQVARLTGKPAIYGFPVQAKSKPRSKLPSIKPSPNEASRSGSPSEQKRNVNSPVGSKSEAKIEDETKSQCSADETKSQKSTGFIDAKKIASLASQPSDNKN